MVQGRDLIEVLAGHPARSAVRARPVELDRHNATIAEGASRRSWPRVAEQGRRLFGFVV